MALVSSLCNAKVYDLDLVLLHNNVAWFDVIVLYTLCMNPCKMLDDALSKEGCS
jgi:hypothetical protein